MQESHPKELRTMVSTIEHFLARFHLADDVDTVDVTEKYQVEHWDALDDELLKKRIVRDCILF